MAKYRLPRVQSEFGEIPGSIPYLAEMLTQASSLEEKHLLFALILSECVRADNPEVELHYLRMQVDSLPLRPILLTSLATALASMPSSGDEAAARCVEAVALARKQNRQLRYSLTCQARIALHLNDYELLGRALTGLVDDAGQQRTEDSCYEFDFVDQIDPLRCDPRLLADFKALA